MESVLKEITLKAGQHIDKETILSLRGTKAINVINVQITDKQYEGTKDWGDIVDTVNEPVLNEMCRTWATAVRLLIESFQPSIDTVIEQVGSVIFLSVYKNNMQKILGDIMKPNINFSQGLYRDDSYIKSTLYKNSKNHKIPILTDEKGEVWYACAVYTEEIIWVLEALLDTLYDITMKEKSPYTSIMPHYMIRITYVDRSSLSSKKEMNDEIKAKFIRYEYVRLSGKYNMFSNKALEMSGLNEEDYDYIQENYTKLQNEFSDVQPIIRICQEFISKEISDVTYVTKEMTVPAGSDVVILPQGKYTILKTDSLV